MVEYPQGDAVLATINGRPRAMAGGSAGSSVFALAAGLSQIELLYENRGFANGGADMERPAGISMARFVPTPNVAGAPIGGWRMQLVDGTGERPEVRPNFDDSGWTTVTADSVEANQLTPNQTAVFRARIEVTADDLNNGKWDLNFGRIDDAGWVYVNGKNVGHTTDWSLPYSFDVTKELHPGANVIAVVVRNEGGGGGIGAPTFGRDLSGVAASLPAFGYPAGVEQGWWQPDFNDRGWQPVAIGSGAPPSGGLLRWYRMGFRLPPGPARCAVAFAPGRNRQRFPLPERPRHRALLASRTATRFLPAAVLAELRRGKTKCHRLNLASVEPERRHPNRHCRTLSSRGSRHGRFKRPMNLARRRD